MRPPGVKERWEDNGPEMQARILAYYQIATHDADEREARLAGHGGPFGGPQPKKGKARSRRK